MIPSFVEEGVVVMIVQVVNKVQMGYKVELVDMVVAELHMVKELQLLWDLAFHNRNIAYHLLVKQFHIFHRRFFFLRVV